MIILINANAKHRVYVTTSLRDAITFALEFGGYVEEADGGYIIFLVDDLFFTDSEKAKLYNFLNFNFHLN